MADLFPVGDRELHFAEGADGSWSFPLYVEYKHHKETDKYYALIIPAVAPYASQLLILQALLGTMDSLNKKDQWLIPKSLVEKLLHKAPGVTPAYYYQWNDPNMPALPMAATLSIKDSIEPAKPKQGSSDHEAFVAWLCKRNGLPNSIVRVVLKAIGNDAATWMLEERRSVDLGFCKLIAAPFRANWKEIVAYKYKHWKLNKLFNLKQSLKMQALEDAGLPAALCSAHNIGLNRSHYRNKTIDYVIEAIPSGAFEVAIYNIEKKRQACGTTSCVASFEKTVESLYGHLVSALETYMRKASLPFAKVYEGGESGIASFLPAQSHTLKVRGMGLRHLPASIISPSKEFSVLAEQGDPSLVPQKAPPMQTLPSVPRGTDDVRECQEQRSMDKPQRTRASRVPLLLTDESVDFRESMFLGTTLDDSEPSGLD